VAMLNRSVVAVLALTGIAPFAGCTGGPSEGTSEGVGEQRAANACIVRSTKAGRQLTAEEVDALEDPIARHVLRGNPMDPAEACPITFEDIQKRLRATDTEGCEDDPASGPAGTQTWIESDRSQLTKKPEGYRSVTSRRCGDRPEFGLLISNQTLKTTDDGLPRGMVIFARDAKSGAFHFYTPGTQWTFIGSSTDLISGGYDCNPDGACMPKTSTTFGCTACHAGGGLNLMEMKTPWVNWEGRTQTPGVSELFTKFGQSLGRRAPTAQLLENMVKAGNSAWVKTRVRFLKGESTKELLRPLFCTIDVNLQTMEGRTVNRISSDLWLDPHWKIDRPIPLDPAAYAKRIGETGQFIQSRPGPLATEAGPATDTFFPLIFPERSDMDARYVDELLAQDVVDEDFVRDVLMTDFTRPTFSPTRCALVDHAPQLTADETNPGAIREGFKKSLEKATTPGAPELFARLGNDKDGDAHAAKVRAFIDTCAGRDRAELTAEVVTYASQLRNAARRNKNTSGRGLQVFPENLPFDNLEPGVLSAFDPTTCKLK
jgi:hypothetical protein